MHKYCLPPQKLGIPFLLKLITQVYSNLVYVRCEKNDREIKSLIRI
jgi:hypothetical protein